MATGINLGKIASNLFRARLAVVHELSEVYQPIARNKDKLLKLLKEKAEAATKSSLARKMRVAKGFYTLEMAPPTSTQELRKLQSHVAIALEFLQSGAYKFLTVKQAWLLFLICLEVYLWFFLGETIGKMHLIGYKV